MELEALIEEVLARGGECAVWLVYLADRFGDFAGGPPALLLQSAFFTRGESYAFAEGALKARMWQHFYVFRLQVDFGWLNGVAPRTGEFEMAFGRMRALPHVSVTPTELASVITK
jgi:hypothetical protein